MGSIPDDLADIALERINLQAQHELGIRFSFSPSGSYQVNAKNAVEEVVEHKGQVGKGYESLVGFASIGILRQVL